MAKIVGQRKRSLYVGVDWFEQGNMENFMSLSIYLLFEFISYRPDNILNLKWLELYINPIVNMYMIKIE